MQAIGTQAVLHAAVRIQQQFAAGPERQRHAPAFFRTNAIDHAAEKFSTALRTEAHRTVSINTAQPFA
jgi:hypothetical protein